MENKFTWGDSVMYRQRRAPHNLQLRRRWKKGKKALICDFFCAFVRCKFLMNVVAFL